jgi:hypothetical protein
MKYVITESQFKRILNERIKISEDERIVISNTPNFLQVIPLTQAAACKYGGATKWCVSGDDDNRFDEYKNKGRDVSMIMIKNPELQEKLKTTKFAFNVWNRGIEIHNDKAVWFDLRNLSKEAGVYDEIKSLMNDYINFMVGNRDLKDYINPFSN